MAAVFISYFMYFTGPHSAYRQTLPGGCGTVVVVCSLEQAALCSSMASAGGCSFLGNGSHTQS